MTSYSIFIQWPDVHSEEFYQEQFEALKNGFPKKLEQASKMAGVELRIGVERRDDVIVLILPKPSRIPDNLFQSLLNQGVKEISKQLKAQTSWVKN